MPSSAFESKLGVDRDSDAVTTVTVSATELFLHHLLSLRLSSSDPSTCGHYFALLGVLLNLHGPSLHTPRSVADARGRSKSDDGSGAGSHVPPRPSIGDDGIISLSRSSSREHSFLLHSAAGGTGSGGSSGRAKHVDDGHGKTQEPPSTDEKKLHDAQFVVRGRGSWERALGGMCVCVRVRVRAWVSGMAVDVVSMVATAQVIPRSDLSIKRLFMRCVSLLRRHESTESFHTSNSDYLVVGAMTLLQYLVQVTRSVQPIATAA